MRKRDTGLFPYYCFDNLLRERGLVHFVSSGERGEYGNLNLLSPKGAENRRMLAAAVGFDVERMVTGEQVHSLNVAVVGKGDIGRGALSAETRVSQCDALITAERGVCVMVLTADCVPVLLADVKRGVVAAVHAGWRGTEGNIVGKTIERMEVQFGCIAKDIVAGIAPCIGKCCFEVGEEVAERFSGYVDRKRGGKPYVDLVEANREALLSKGVLAEHIELSGLCTRCTSDFYSYRRDAGSLNRFGSGIMLK